MTVNAADSVKVQWTGTGTGTMTLGAAITGFQAFPSALDTLEVSYLVEHTAAGTVERENGRGTYDSSAGTLTRGSITFSTNGNALVNFSVGIKHVSLVLLAVDLEALDDRLNALEIGDLDSVLGFDSGGNPIARPAGNGITIDNTNIRANFGTTSTTVTAGNRGLPAGGSTGQALTKASASDYDVNWTNVSGSGGLEWQANGNTAITIGSGTDGKRYTLTSDSAITLTLDAQATAGMETTVVRGGAGTVTVQVESGATYWVPGQDQGGAGATASFTVIAASFVCVDNVGGNSAEWEVIANGSLTTEIQGDALFYQSIYQVEAADADSDTAGRGQIWTKSDTPNNLYFTDDAGNDYKLNGGRVITSVTGALTYAVHHGNTIVTSGNVTVPNAAGDVGMQVNIIAGGAHTVTFNSLTSAAMASGGVMTVVVQSTTVIKAVYTAPADLVAFS